MCVFLAAEEQTAVSDTLPGSGEPIPSLEQRLSPRVNQDESEDEYGPALPPALPSQLNTGSVSSLAFGNWQVPFLVGQTFFDLKLIT